MIDEPKQDLLVQYLLGELDPANGRQGSRRTCA